MLTKNIMSPNIPEIKITSVLRLSRLEKRIRRIISEEKYIKEYFVRRFTFFMNKIKCGN